MAFFDDFGKKLSQAGQSAVQKTKEVTDIARINAAIGEQEKQAAEIYSEIGKLYVTQYPNGTGTEFQTLLERLRNAENKIFDYRKQIQEIKGVVRCQTCGAEVAAHSAFCNSCGAKILVVPSAATAVDTAVCPACGALNGKDSHFCTSCGTVLTEPSDETNLPQSKNTIPMSVKETETLERSDREPESND